MSVDWPSVMEYTRFVRQSGRESSAAPEDGFPNINTVKSFPVSTP